VRRSLIPFLLALLTAGVLSASVAAKEMNVELSAAPPSLGSGEPWAAELVVEPDAGMREALAEGKLRLAPKVLARNDETGETLEFPARPSGEPNVYDVRVVLPSGGTWSIEATDSVTDRAYEFGSITVAEDALPPAGTAKSKRTDSESFPLFPLAGGVVLLVGLGGAALLVRRFRPGRAGVQEAR
jgi:hypothetical protein